MANLDGWGLSWVVSIFFEGGSEDADLLSLEVEVEGLEDS